MSKKVPEDNRSAKTKFEPSIRTKSNEQTKKENETGRQDQVRQPTMPNNEEPSFRKEAKKNVLVLRKPVEPRSLNAKSNVHNSKTPQIPRLVSSGPKNPAGGMIKQTKPTTRVQKQASSGSQLPNRVASHFSTNDIKENITSRLKKKSPWYDSIMNPITGGGVKIPDPIGTNTGTYQHVQNVSVPVSAGGVSGLRICSPYVNAFAGGAGVNYQITVSGTPTALNWGNPLGTAGFPFAVVPGLMQANSHAHRVVSAAVVCQPEVSSLSDAGEMCAFVTPFDIVDGNPTYATYQAKWDSTMLPVNAHKPLIARWYPLENQAFLFDPTTNSSDPTDDKSISYREFISPLFNNDDGIIPWEVGVVCSGMAASVGTVRFQIIVNYEFIPLLSSAMVLAEPSPIDPMEEQLVNSWISNEPVTSLIPQKQASMAPAESRVAEEPSGFGMLFNVIEEMLPLAKPLMALL